jgi:hypothetical protein
MRQLLLGLDMQMDACQRTQRRRWRAAARRQAAAWQQPSPSTVATETALFLSHFLEILQNNPKITLKQSCSLIINLQLHLKDPTQKIIGFEVFRL